MKKYRIAIVGLGATGTVLAAALLCKNPQTVVVGRSTGMGETLFKKGIGVSGVISYFVPVENYCAVFRILDNTAPILSSSVQRPVILPGCWMNWRWF